MTVPTRDIINATVERALGYETKRNETKIVWVPWPGRMTAGYLGGPHDLFAGQRTEPGPAIAGKRSKPVAERGETSRTIISDRGSRGGLGPSRYPRHGAQRDVIARVETVRERV